MSAKRPPRRRARASTITNRQRARRAKLAEAHFNDHVCTQLHNARTQHSAAVAAYSTKVGSHLSAYSVLALCQHQPCGSLCVANHFGLRVFMYAPLARSEYERCCATAARHMFMEPKATALAVELTILPRIDVSQRVSWTAGGESIDPRMLHVCGKFCAAQQQNSAQRGPPDAIHAHELRSERLQPNVYFCEQHARFHVCDSCCQFLSNATATTQRCALSGRTFAQHGAATQFAFGDGTGTAERARITEQIMHGGNDYDGFSGGTRRRRTGQTRQSSLRITTAGAAALAQGRRTAKRKKTRKSRGGIAAVQRQAPIVVQLSESDIALVRRDAAHECGEHAVSESDHMTTTAENLTVERGRITFLPQAPFERRQLNNIFEHELALDEWRDLLCRPSLVARFAVSARATQNTFFPNASLLTHHLVKAYEIIYRMLFGYQRCAIDAKHRARSHDAGCRAVQQYVTACRKERVVIELNKCDRLYEMALVTAANYTRLVLTYAQQRAILAYYALVVVEFYFSLRVLPVDVPHADAESEYATVRTDYKFEHFVPNIMHLMRSELTIYNVRVLPYDMFIAAQYMPNSATLREMGLPENTCTRLRRATMKLLKTARQSGTLMRRIEATELEWSTVLDAANSGSQFGVIARVVERFLAARRARLAAVTTVVDMRDDPHPCLIDLT